MNTQPEWRTLLAPGATCWRIEHAARASVLVESGVYFEALREACEQARRSIFISGWDFDRREKLGRGPHAQTMQDFFCGLLDQRPHLQLWLLTWDYAFVYAAEREWFQEQRLRYFTHERFHVHFDGAHPLGASQHQKFAVIDDCLAFSGGIDLSRWRWDTRDHAPGDTRRLDPDGERYQPFHDVMIAMDGAAARAYGELARERWARAGAPGNVAPGQAPPQECDLWPGSVPVVWRNCQLGIARTLPAWDGHPAVSEVKHLYLESIRRARNYIYIENQYFTARSLSEALGERLQEPSGPEVVIVLPRRTGGWLEQVTMDELRALRVKELRSHDRHGRLKVLYPHQPGLPGDECIMVHAKLMIADDLLVRIGSANTSNRSMGLDSECDVALMDGEGDGARRLLHRLLAEHLDVDEEIIADRRQALGSLGCVIDDLARREGRSLRELPLPGRPALLDVGDQKDLLDPEEPLDAGSLIRRAVPQEQKNVGRRRLWGFVSFVVLLLVLAGAWRWTSLGEWVDAERLAGALALFDSMLVRFLTVLVAIIITSLLMMPLTALVVASALLLGPWLGFAASMAGALLSAAVAFAVGEKAGGSIIHRFGQSRVHKLSERLSDRGILAVAVLRMMPVAPYTIVNVVAGASHLRLIPFLVGSAIGLLPGLAALSWFSGSLFEAIKNPDASSLAVLGVVVILIVGGALLLRKLLRDS